MKALLPWSDVDAPSTVEVVAYDGTTRGPQTALDSVEFYALPLTFSATPLKLISRLPNLRVLQTLTAGYEHVMPYVPEDVTFCAGGTIHATSVAEWAVSLILASLHDVPGFVRAHDRGEWAHRPRRALADRTVVVVGMGSVGSALAERLRAFECDVVGVASRPRNGVRGVEELAGLLPTADVVVLTVPLSEDTHHLVDAAFLAAMPDNSLLVNVGRGPVVETGALLAEVGSGRLRATLDVTDPEPLPPDHPAWTTPGLLVTPHVGGNSTAFSPRAKTLVAEQLRRWVAGRPLRNVVEVPA